MTEPTYTQHKILEMVRDNFGEIFRKGKEDDIDDIYAMVRAGYLKNLVMLGGEYDWKFKLTEKGEKYLESVGANLR